MCLDLKSCFDWLLAWLVETTSVRFQTLQKEGNSLFHVRNNMQVFYAQTLSIVYGQRVIFNCFLQHIENLDDSAEKAVLQRVLALYGSNLLLRHIGILYEVCSLDRVHRCATRKWKL